MDVKWHIAFCNVTFTKYAGITYRDYYASPTNMLEAQLKSKNIVEKKFGVGSSVNPYPDCLPATFASCFGMSSIKTEDDELPYVDVQHPALKKPMDIDSLDLSNPWEKGLLAKRLEAWKYYRAQGYEVGFGGMGAPILSTAHEISGGDILMWLLDDPENSKHTLDLITETELKIRSFGEELCGGSVDSAYTGDDFSGLLSPDMYREFAIPQYERIYAGRTTRFMHSELLRAEHLRIAKDLLQITAFHGAGCENLTLEEMYEIMGNDFWTQITPQELHELSPDAIIEKVKKYAGSGAGYIQLYPGRETPDRNFEAAITACQRECTGGCIGSI